MIIWINGPFGAGKTTVTAQLLQTRPDFVMFDTEHVGFLLGPPLQERKPVADFQDWVSWRRLVVATLAELHDELNTDIVVPQTVVVEQYWSEIASGLAERGIGLRAFTLDVTAEEHERRIATDRIETQAAGWRRQRRADFDAALPWLRARTHVIDTTEILPTQVAEAVIRALDNGR
ncbi:MAG: AAA family ATPase [Microlunatus sp.]